MNILVTGARAPIAVDIARALVSQGHRVWVADSFEHPVARHTPGLQGYVKLAPPTQDFAAFSAELVTFCRTQAIDLVVPTSEEVFWLSRVTGLPAGCGRACPPPQTLELLHHKGRFAQLANELAHGPGHCHELSSREDVEAFLAAGRDTRQWVFKQVYSRFANHVLVGPTPGQLKMLSFEAGNPWLAQPRIEGREVCLYNVAHQGEVLLHQAYLPRWRAGAGASLYFEPVQDPALLQFSQAVAQHTAFTGQLSFDVMLTESGVVALECNPRGTSGVHLAVQDMPGLAQALTGHVLTGHSPRPRPSLEVLPRALHLPLLLYHPRLWLSPEGRKTLFRANDAMREAGIGAWAQLKATAELLAYARRHRLCALRAGTRDIEYNGERP